MAIALFLAGLVLIVVSVVGLAGIYWALLAAGAVCIGLAVLTESAPASSRSSKGSR